MAKRKIFPSALAEAFVAAGVRAESYRKEESATKNVAERPDDGSLNHSPMATSPSVDNPQAPAKRPPENSDWENFARGVEPIVGKSRADTGKPKPAPVPRSRAEHVASMRKESGRGPKGMSPGLISDAWKSRGRRYFAQTGDGHSSRRMSVDARECQPFDGTKADHEFRGYMEMLAAVYRPPGRREGKKSPEASNGLSCIRIVGPVKPNPSAFPYDPVGARLIPQHSGIAEVLSDAPSGSNEIFIGLDFGTSTLKVVLQDTNRRVHYAVPFFHVGASNPFLLPCTVYLAGDTYSLDRPNVCDGETPEVFRDLKLTLMREPEKFDYMIHVTAFLALAIRHARGWLFSEHAEVYVNEDLLWGLNLGLPAEKSENDNLSDRFRGIAIAAANLASYDGAVDRRSAARYLDKATRALTDDQRPEALELTVYPDMVGVYPEIAAQVVAFVESERWDGNSRPYITMVDVGAGTVDVSFFSVNGKHKRTFRFFKNKVAENGVVNLHRQRVTWLRDELGREGALNDKVSQYLEDIFTSTDRVNVLPASVSEYVTGLELIGNGDVDSEFRKKRYCKQVFGDVLKPVHERRVPYGDHWDSLPVFVCGGGSRMQLYSDIVEQLNQIPGINWLAAQRYHLTKPDRLRADGLPENEYDRLSVAYGLSFAEIGQIIKSSEIADLERRDLPTITVEAPSKDVC